MDYKRDEKVNRLIDNIASKYSLAYNVNIEDDSFIIIRIDESILLGEEKKFDCFSQAKRFILEEVIHPIDRPFMERELDYATIREKSRNAKAYSVEYRSLVAGVSNWNEMFVSMISDTNVAIGFAVDDLEVTRRHIEEKRFDEYLSLYVVDLDTEMIKSVKVPENITKVPVRTVVPYGEAMKKYAAICTGEAREFFEQISDIEFLKSQFIDNDKFSFTYKSPDKETDKWIDLTGYVIFRHEDNTPALLSLGFSLSDALATARQKMQAQLNEDMHIIGGLAGRYDSLYYVNIDENSCKAFRMKGQKLPEAQLISTPRGDVFEFFRTEGKSERIHPEDRKNFAELNAENIRKRLSHSKSFQIRFRRDYGTEYRWCEMEVIKYEDINERANSIAVGFASRDALMRSEQAINDCFSILGKEIPPQESIDTLLSIVGEFYGAERVYIFEKDRDKQFISNTYEWCREGVLPMMDKLQSVPADSVDGWRHGINRENVESHIYAPLFKEDETAGFIGVDNPTRAMKNIEVLRTVAVVAHSEILKRKQDDEEHVTLRKLTDAFVSVYYVDLSTDYMRTWKIDDDYKEEYGRTEKYSVSMGGYVKKNILEKDRGRCSIMTSPEYILDRFRVSDRFSIDMTDVMLGYERNFVFDYIKVNEEGTQLVICCRDVTAMLKEERRQQKLLEEARNAAEEASKSKTRFLFNMSHDIRTPMNAITGFTNMAKKYIDDKERLIGYLDKIDTSGMQLLSLVNQVLEMARIESGKIELDENPINISDEYNSMVVVLSEQASEYGLEFNHSLVNIKHNRILADRARMSSITLNIVGNAMKYTQKGGRIDFTLKEIPARKADCATLVYTVEDTGIGMSKEYLKVLFEPFTREKSSTVSKIQGTGLGMAIVKNLVDLMGGDIEVKSEIGKGTRFDITIDFKINDNGLSEKGIDVNLSSVSFKGKRVLLVEDNELNREIAFDILADEGFETDEASDGTVAVKMMEDAGPDYYDFVLMDIQMPLMNGYEATKAIRKMYPDAKIPIIALSANAFSEDCDRSFAAGMDEHVSKPINKKILLSTLAKFL